MQLKKVTQKNKDGSSITYEYNVPPKQEIPHPGSPRGTDTVPAWLTPGEYVMNAEATRMYKPQIEAMNDHGKAMQAAQGGTVPQYKAEGGGIMDWLSSLFGGSVPQVQWPENDQGIDPNIMVDRAPASPPPQRTPAQPKVSPRDWIIGNTLGHEGGKANDPTDKGGKTNFGITQKTYDAYGFKGDVNDLTPEKAKEFYNTYYDSFNVDSYPAEIRDHVFDMFTNHSPQGVAKILQKAAGVKQDGVIGPKTMAALKKVSRQDLVDARKEYYEKIMSDDPSQEKFRNGWIARAESFGGKPVYLDQGGDPVLLQAMMALEDPNTPEDTRQRAESVFTSRGQPVPQVVPQYVPEVDDAPAPPEVDPNAMVDSLNRLSPPNIYTGEQQRPHTDPYDDGVRDSSASAAEQKGVQIFGSPETTAELEGMAKRIANGEEQQVVKEQIEKNLPPPIDVPVPDIADKFDSKVSNTIKAKDEAVDAIANATQEQADNEFSNYSDEDWGNFIDDAIGEGNKDANENPDKLASVMNFFDEYGISDLFDKKEIGKMAVMYLGSRALGYSHGGSLNFAMKNYATNVQAKQTQHAKDVQSLLKEGKYSKASIRAYEKSKDIDDLIPAGNTYIPQGTYETIEINTGTVENPKWVKTKVQKVKGSDDGYYWQAPTGQIVPMESNQVRIYDKTLDPTTTEGQTYYAQARSDAENIYKGIRSEFEEDDLKGSYNAQSAAKDFTSWTADKKLNPKDPRVQGVVGIAYRQMLADHAKGIKSNNLEHYLTMNYMAATTGSVDMWITNPDEVAEGKPPQTLSGDEVMKVTTKAKNFGAAMLPDVAPQVAADTIIKHAMKKFAAEDQEYWKEAAEKASSGKHRVSAFSLFLTQKIDEFKKENVQKTYQENN